MNKKETNSEFSLFSITETAKLMKIGKKTLKTLISQGKIGWLRIKKRIYIPFSEVQKFYKENIKYKVEEDKVANDLNNSPIDINSMDIFNETIGDL